MGVSPNRVNRLALAENLTGAASSSFPHRLCKGEVCKRKVIYVYIMYTGEV